MNELVRNRPGVRARERDRAQDLAVAHHGNAKPAPVTGRYRFRLVRVLGVGQDVLDTDGSAVADDAGADRVTARLERVARPMLVRAGAVRGLQVNQLAVESRHIRKLGRAKGGRTLGDRIEHRLHVRGRTCNDAKDLRGRRLPLQRLLRLVEQAHVFDRDHGLVGEGFQEGDVLRVERALRRPRHDERADPLVIPQHRYLQHGLYAVGPCDRALEFRDVVAFPVRNMQDLAVEDDLRGKILLAVERQPAHLFGQVLAARRGIAGHDDLLPLAQQDRHIHPVDQPGAGSSDRVEHRLRVVRRTADDTQDLGGRRLPLQGLLGLVEQPHVLDRDHGLVGKGRHQADLAGGKGPGPRARDADRPNRLAVPDHRHGEHTAKAPRARHRLAFGRGFRILFGIRVELGGRASHHPAMDVRGIGQRDRSDCLQHAVAFVARRSERRKLQVLAAHAGDHGGPSAQQPDRVLGDGVEDGLRIGGRTRNDVENFRGRRLALLRGAQFGTQAPDFCWRGCTLLLRAFERGDAPDELPVFGQQFGLGWAGHDGSPYYSITRSARTRIDCGILIPCSRAALRLTTSSNFTGCWTGRAAGFAPLRILSTYSAARR